MAGQLTAELFVNARTGQWTALADAASSIFQPSGANHAAGLVPDPGSSAGTTRFLREDAAFAAPTNLTNAQLSNMAAGTLKGRAYGAGTGVPTDLNMPLVNAKDLSVIGDGVTDDTTALNNAITTASGLGKALFLPASTYLISASLSLAAKSVIVGEGPLSTIIKAKNSSNISTMINATVDQWRLYSFQLDGNSANNASGGSGIFTSSSIKYVIDSVWVQHAPTRGFDLTGPDSSATFGMEPTIRNVVIDTAGTHGIYFAGAHDAHFENVIVIDAGQSANATYAGFFLDTGGNGRFFNCHAWHRSSVTNRMSYGVDLNNTGCNFVACLFEGGYTGNARINGSGNTFVGCSFFSAYNGKNIIIKQAFTALQGCQLMAPIGGRPTCKGIILGEGGDNAAQCFISVIAADQQAGMIDFTNNGGSNFIDLRGFQGAAGATNIVGAAAASDIYRIYIAGGNGGAGTAIHNP